MNLQNLKNSTKNIILATGLTAIALTGIGCEGSRASNHNDNRPPVRAGYSTQANREYVDRQKTRIEHKEKLPWPPPYPRAGYNSQINDAYSKKQGL